MNYNNLNILFWKNYSLVKNHEIRSSCTDLLKDEFILKYLDQKNDPEMIKYVIEKIKLDKIESWFNLKKKKLKNLYKYVISIW